MVENRWIASLKPYEGGDTWKSIGQFSLTLTSYLMILAAMVYVVSTRLPYWIALSLAVPAALFHVKLFIIMHDCGHNSYLASSKASAWIGRVCGLLTFTPYYDWLRSHARHHGTVSNLEKRGVGDVWTVTAAEYRSMPFRTRIRYRLFRSPFFLFFLAPVLQFVILFRIPLRDTGRKCLQSVLLTDLALALIITGFSLTAGFPVYLKVILPVTWISGLGGVWLFYVQHQFRNVYWAHSADWDSVRAAMEGSSFYRLPGMLRWFSGSIGYHHIHHLNPRIPNYNLRRCYREIPEVREVTPITFAASLQSLFLHLWDENSGTLVSFREARHLGHTGS